MPAAQCQGVQIEYQLQGDPTAPPLVLIMGLGMQLTAWPEELCEALVAAGFQVLRFDNRDAGLSTRFDALGRPNLAAAFLRYSLHLPVPAPYLLQDMAADTLHLLNSLALPAAHIVGISMGGMIAQVLAAQHPDRVRSLTSIMSSSGARGLPGPRASVLRVMLGHPLDTRDLDRATDYLVRLFQTLGSPAFPTEPELLRAYLARGVQRAHNPVGTLRQLLAIVATGDRSALLKKIRVPSLILHGDADPLVPLEAGRDTAKKIPGARLQIIPGMGHDLGAWPLLVQAIVAHAGALPS